MNNKTQLGTVKFYLVRDGYGFIIPDGQDDVKENHRFFHHSQLQVERVLGAGGGRKTQYKAISQGARVSFVPVQNDKGLAAMNVTPI